MSGICGWIGGLERDAQSDRLVGTMCAAMKYGQNVTTAAQHAGGAALGVAGDVGAMSILADGPLLAASEGYPIWRDRELAEVARVHGHAAALIRGYKRLGRDLPKAVHGHAVIAVIDAANERALVAIDRLGTRTMCYATGGRGLIFGSSADAVRAHPQSASEIDPQAIYSYLWFSKVPSPQTIYRDQRKLMPGQSIWFERGQIEVDRYWAVPYALDGSRDAARLGVEMLTVARRSLDRALDGAAGQVGSFLSGGLDSSTVVGLMAERAIGPTPAFTIGFDEPGYDEMEYARISAKHFGAAHYEYYVTPDDVAEAIPIISAGYDEPFGNASAVPVYYCARLAQQNGIRLLMAGDGGDELFGGNARYAKQKIFERYAMVPGWLRRGLIEPVVGNMPLRDAIMPLRKLWRYIEQANIPLPFRMEAHNLYAGTSATQIFLPDVARTIDVGHPQATLEEVYHRTPSQDILHRMMHLDLQLILADDDLRKVRRMCEIAGVAVKFPLLDDEFVEFSAKVPPELLIDGFKLRHFFKEACRGFLPEATLTKTKHGFGLPYGPWLRSGRLRALAGDAIASLKAYRLFEPAFLDEALRKHEVGHAAYHGAMVWDLMMLGCWLNAHRGPG